jgi:hypothetical protein
MKKKRKWKKWKEGERPERRGKERKTEEQFLIKCRPEYQPQSEQGQG